MTSGLKGSLCMKKIILNWLFDCYGLQWNGEKQIKLMVYWLRLFFIITFTFVVLYKYVIIPEMKESDLDKNILCSGIFFPLEADCDGCVLLVFKCSKHTKGSAPLENIKKCINYWFERIER